MEISGIELITRPTQRAHRNLIVLSLAVFLARILDVPLEEIGFLEAKASPVFWDLISCTILAALTLQLVVLWRIDFVTYTKWFNSIEILDSQIHVDDIGVKRPSPYQFIAKRLKELHATVDEGKLDPGVKDAADRISKLCTETSNNWREVSIMTLAVVYGWYLILPLAFAGLAACSVYVDVPYADTMRHNP